MIELIFGLAIGFVIGILTGAGLGGSSNVDRTTYRYDDNERAKRYMNDPVVRELNEQAQTKNLP